MFKLETWLTLASVRSHLPFCQTRWNHTLPSVATCLRSSQQDQTCLGLSRSPRQKPFRVLRKRRLPSRSLLSFSTIQFRGSGRPVSSSLSTSSRQSFSLSQAFRQPVCPLWQATWLLLETSSLNNSDPTYKLVVFLQQQHFSLWNRRDHIRPCHRSTDSSRCLSMMRHQDHHQPQHHQLPSIASGAYLMSRLCTDLHS